MLQINWILSNIQNDSEQINRKPGTSVVQASTSDKDFEAMVQKQIAQIKKSKK